MDKLFGIDISHWQGDLSIKQARDERGVQFVIVKAAGADAGKYKDSKFEDYYAQCKAIGMPVGAYYYGNAKSVADAQVEADHFLSVIAGKEMLMLALRFSDMQSNVSAAELMTSERSLRIALENTERDFAMDMASATRRVSRKHLNSRGNMTRLDGGW